MGAKIHFIIIMSVCGLFYISWYSIKWMTDTCIDCDLLPHNPQIAVQIPRQPLSGAAKQMVYKGCKSFSQTKRMLGSLKRNTSNGELYFPPEITTVQYVHLLVRYSPREVNEGGLQLQLATSYLLSKNLQRLSIQQRARTRVDVFLSETYSTEMYSRLEQWFQAMYAAYSVTTRVIPTKAGNQASWEYMMNSTKHNEKISLDTILFLLEDDYIYEADMLLDTIEFFVSHNPCFVHPTDYPDRYRMNINDDDGRITIVAGRTRLWRSITSTTVTYVCRLRTFLAFGDIIMQPKRDWGASHDVRLRGGNAVFFSAIPSHGAHTETLRLHHKNEQISEDDTAAYHKDWWLFARRTLLEAQKMKLFPAAPMDERDLLAK